RLADQHGPEPGLADAVLLPHLERDGVEPLEQRRKPSRDAVIDPHFIDHGVLLGWPGAGPQWRATLDQAGTARSSGAFDGEFSDHSQSYAGTGGLKLSW